MVRADARHLVVRDAVGRARARGHEPLDHDAVAVGPALFTAGRLLLQAIPLAVLLQYVALLFLDAGKTLHTFGIAGSPYAVPLENMLLYNFLLIGYQIEIHLIL